VREKHLCVCSKTARDCNFGSPVIAHTIKTRICAPARPSQPAPTDGRRQIIRPLCCPINGATVSRLRHRRSRLTRSIIRRHSVIHLLDDDAAAAAAAAAASVRRCLRTRQDRGLGSIERAISLRRQVLSVWRSHSSAKMSAPAQMRLEVLSSRLAGCSCSCCVKK